MNSDIVDDQQNENFQYLLSQKAEISIEIYEVQTRGDMSGKYVTYGIRGSDTNGPFDVFRRFSEFISLRNALVIRWPGSFIPPIPPKQTIGNLDSKCIDQRKIFLYLFLSKLSESTAIWQGDETNQFLHSSEPDVSAMLQNLPRLTYEELIQKFEQSYRHLQGQEITTDLNNRIQGFQKFLKRTLPMLNNFREIYRNMTQARDQHNDQYMTFISYLLPEYERTCLLEYSNEGKAIFSDLGNEEYVQVLERMKLFLQKNEFQLLYDAAKQESREIEAFQESFNQRDFYEEKKTEAQSKLKSMQIEMQEVIAGKKTLKSIFSSSSKDVQINKLQIKIEQQIKEIDQLLLICDVITVILGMIEIQRFKEYKEQNYIMIIRSIAEFELEHSKMTAEYWQVVLGNKHVILKY